MWVVGPVCPLAPHACGIPHCRAPCRGPCSPPCLTTHGCVRPACLSAYVTPVPRPAGVWTTGCARKSQQPTECPVGCCRHVALPARAADGPTGHAAHGSGRCHPNHRYVTHCARCPGVWRLWQARGGAEKSWGVWGVRILFLTILEFYRRRIVFS